jgi:Chaperone of endosialidase
MFTMNQIIQLRSFAVIVISIVVFGCLGFLPQMQAVSPAPDGCYPNFTTAEGCEALSSLTTGAGNTGLGFRSLFLDSAGSFNTAVGAEALALNEADSNTAVGAAALLLNSGGSENVAVGTAALVFNDSGSFNSAFGAFALLNNTADQNTAIGAEALTNTTAPFNTAVGAFALSHNTEGSSNVATGSNVLFFNTTGSSNTANGEGALGNNTEGDSNTAIGFHALFLNSTGGNNVALGASAGSAQTTGSNNVYIGTNVQGVAAESNACYIKSIFSQTSASGTAVFVNSNNKLGTATSSKRFKEKIEPMNKASEALFALQPVSFRYKKEIDPDGISQLGLVAEDVEKVNPDLVVRDKEGKPYSVRYDQVNAMLLNEFLKAYKKMQDLEARDAQQQEQIEALTKQLREQAAQIQKVSAQHELGEPAPKVASNDR